jgi:hypothetical protein
MRNRKAEFLGAIKQLAMHSSSEEEKWKIQSRLNRIKSLRHGADVARSKAVIDDLLSRLRSIATSHDPGPGKSFLHFVYGFKDSEELPYYAYLAIKSAQFHNPGWKVVFVCVHEPTGRWWDEIKDSLILIKMLTFDYFLGSRFYHYAHKADVVRLLMLRELGGVYLDMDTITVRPFTELLEHEFGMAVQGSADNSVPGLCNAVMWCKRNSFFCSQWIEQYSHFRSRGRDDLWDFHSVKLPAILAGRWEDKITILHHRAFFYPLWMDAEKILFTERGDRFLPYLSSAYGFHLWNGSTEKTLRRVSPEWVASSTSVYAHFARPVAGSAEPASPDTAARPAAKARPTKDKTNRVSLSDGEGASEGRRLAGTH